MHLNSLLIKFYFKQYQKHSKKINPFDLKDISY